MHSLFSCPGPPAPVSFRRLARGLHGVAKQASFYVAFRSDFRGFGRRRSSRKSMLELILFDVFFECVFASIFARLLEARSLRNINLASTGAWFLRNRHFQKPCKTNAIFGVFWEAKAMRNREQSCSKACFFRTSSFMCFFFDFDSIWGSKNHLKIIISRKNGGSETSFQSLLP